MDQTVTRKETTTIVSNTITSQPQAVQPIVKNRLLKPAKDFNANILTQMKKRGRLPKNISQGQTQKNDKVEQTVEQIPKQTDNDVLKKFGSTAEVLQKRYGKQGLAVAKLVKLARRGAVVPKGTKQSVNVPKEKKGIPDAVKPKYTNIQRMLMKKGYVPRRTIRKLDEQSVKTYQEYLSLKAELLIVTSEERRNTLISKLADLETNNSALLQTIGGAEFDDIKDGIMMGYQNALTEMTQHFGKPITQEKFDQHVQKFTNLNNQVNGLIEKVKSQETKTEEWNNAVKKIDERIETLEANITSEVDPGKKAEMQTEVDQLVTKFKPMIQEMIDGAISDAQRWTMEIQSLKKVQDMFSRTLSQVYQNGKIDPAKVLEVTAHLSKMISHLSNIGSVIINQQVVSLWTSQTALEFMNVWSIYHFLNDVTNLDDEKIRDYMIAKRSNGLDMIQENIAVFVSRVASTGADLQNVTKKAKRMSDALGSTKDNLVKMRDEIKNLNQAVRKLSEVNKNTKIKIGEQTLTKAQLKVKLAQLRGQMRSIETNLLINDKKQENVNESIESLEELKAYVDKLEVQYAKIQTFMQDNTSMIPTMRVLSGMMKIANDYKTTAKIVNAQVTEEKRAQIIENKKLFEAQQREAEKLRKEVDEVQQSKTKAINEKEVAEAEKEQAKARLQQIEEQQRNTVGLLNQLKNEVQLKNIEISELNQGSSQLTIELNEKRTKIEQLEEQLRVRESEASSLRAKEEQLGKAIKALEMIENGKMAKLSELNNNIVKENQKLEQLVVGNTALETKRSQLLQQYANEEQLQIEALRQKLKDEQDGIVASAVRATEERLQGQISTLANQIDQHQSKIETAKNRVATEKQSIIDDLKRELSTLRTNQSKLVGDATRPLEEQILSLQQQINGHQQEIDTAVRTATAAQQHTISQLRSQMQTLQDSIPEIKREAEKTAKDRLEQEYKAKKEQLIAKTKLKYKEELQGEALAAIEEDKQRALDEVKRQQEEFNNNKKRIEEEIRTAATEAEALQWQNKLTEQKATHDAQVSQLQAQIAEQQQKLAELETLKNQNRDLVTKLEEQQSLIDTYSEAVREGTAKIEELTDAKAEVDAKLSSAESNLRDVTAERNSLANQLEALQTRLSELQIQYERQTVELNNATNALNTKTEEFNELQSQKQQVDEQLNAAKETIKTHEQTISHLEGKLSAEQGKVIDLGNQLSRANQQLSQNETKIDDLNKSVDRLTNEKNQKQTKLDEAKRKLKDAKEALRTKEGKLQEQAQQIVGAQVSLAAEKQRVTALEGLVSALENTLSSTQQKLTEAERKVEQLTLENETLTGTVSRLNNQLETAQSQINQLNEEAEGYREQIRQLTDSFNNLSERNQQLVSANEALNNEVSRVTELNQQLQTEKQQLTAKVASLEDVVRERDNTISLQQEELAQKQEKITTLEQELSELKRKNDELQIENQRLAGELASEKSQRKEVANMLKRQDDWGEIKKAIEQMQDANAKLESKTSEQSVTLGTLAPLLLNKSGKQFTPEELEQKMEMLNALVAKYRTDGNQDTFSIIEELAANYETSKDKATTLEGDLATEKQNYSDLKEKNDEMEANYSQLMTDFNDLDAKHKQVEANLLELQSNFDAQSLELGEAKANLIKMQSEFEVLIQKAREEADSAIKNLESERGWSLSLLSNVYQEELQKNPELKKELDTKNKMVEDIIEDYKRTRRELDSMTVPDEMDIFLQKQFDEAKTAKGKETYAEAIKKRKVSRRQYVIDAAHKVMEIHKRVFHLKAVHTSLQLELDKARSKAQQALHDEQLQQKANEQKALQYRLSTLGTENAQLAQQVGALQIQQQETNKMKDGMYKAHLYWDPEAGVFKHLTTEQRILDNRVQQTMEVAMRKIPGIKDSKVNDPKFKRVQANPNKVANAANSLMNEHFDVVRTLGEQVVQWMSTRYGFVHLTPPDVRNANYFVALKIMEIYNMAGEFPSAKLLYDTIIDTIEDDILIKDDISDALEKYVNTLKIPNFSDQLRSQLENKFRYEKSVFENAESFNLTDKDFGTIERLMEDMLDDKKTKTSFDELLALLKSRWMVNALRIGSATPEQIKAAFPADMVKQSLYIYYTERKLEKQRGTYVKNTMTYFDRVLDRVYDAFHHKDEKDNLSLWYTQAIEKAKNADYIPMKKV